MQADNNAPGGFVAKLTDFGLSIALDPTATHMSNVKTGTPFYTAPEVVAERRATKASDIYGFGVLMWEMATGKPPWVEGPEPGTFERHPKFPNLPLDAEPAYAELQAR